MKVAGFSFVRNAIKFDYPVLEAIQSILPICDIFYIAVGKSEDATLELIQSLNHPKIKIIETVWDDSLRQGGRVLAVETNKAFDAIAEEYDWAFYIQGDEIVHEKYLPIIKEEMQNCLDNPMIDGLLFKYLHFYGSYSYVADSRKWYRREIRVIRNNKQIRSYRDAQGFRFDDNTKLKVKLIDAYVYHYGWVKNPSNQQAKQLTFNKLWHNDEWMDKNVAKVSTFDYSNIDSLALFDGTHPKIIQPRIDRVNWEFDFDVTKKKFKLKDRILIWVEKNFGWRIGEYRNYRLLDF